MPAGSSSRRGRFSRLLGQPPLGPAVLEALRPMALGAQAADGVVRVGADRTVGRELSEPVLELLERDRARRVDVAGLELLGRSNVDQHHVAFAQPLDELVAADGVDFLTEILARGPLD